ncbi:MAG TPA: NTP transferase domain-containing protein [Gammaproteobacteria bacterium]
MISISDNARTAGQDPVLWGLVLAGGASTRMGEDKGSVDVHGVPQAIWASQCLGEHCARVLVSVRAAQADQAPYRSLPTIVDAGESFGPATGLLTAWQRFPLAAWLAIGVDMPYLTRDVVGGLIAGRSAAKLATAYRRADGGLEPLCTIWEPAARGVLWDRARAGDTSLRRLLETGDIAIVDLPDRGALASVNSPTELARARRNLASFER